MPRQGMWKDAMSVVSSLRQVTLDIVEEHRRSWTQWD
jgi:hypothetical protein